MENRTVKAEAINEVHWNNGLTYDEYRKLTGELLALNKTTGDNHSEKMIEYTQLNEKRMNKWDKIAKIIPSLENSVKSIKAPQKWLVLTEAWCGDAAQNLPFINKLAELNPNIQLHLLLRDENLDVMDAYLTNGGRSIPKLIILDDELNELAQWGPRPAPAQEKLLKMKEGGMTYEEYAIELHTWYGKDRGAAFQTEMEALLSSI